MKRNEQIAPIKSNQNRKKKSISLRKSNQSSASITLPKLNQAPLNSTYKNFSQVQRIRPQTAKIDQKSLTYGHYNDFKRLKKPIELDEFMKSARRVDYNCKSLTSQIIPITNLEQQDDPDFVPEYIDTYVRNLMSNDAAYLIQSNFRLYVEKKNWKGLIHHRIWNRLDALRRIFVGWHGYVSKDITVINKCYNKFASLFREKPWLSRKQTLSPFRLFYLNGRWFYPKHHDPRDIYIITRLFEHSNARRFLNLWKSISHSMRQLRPWKNTVRYTNEKICFFGSVFNAFHVWQRYTQWKKLTIKTDKPLYLKCSETIIAWNVLERKLNDKKMQQLRAGRASLKRIKKKGFLAIYQKYVDHLRALTEFESSYKFYLHHLQYRARNAWSVFITLQHANKLEMKKIMKSWYSISFQAAKRKNLLIHVSEYIQTRRLSFIFRAWKREAHELKLTSMLNSIKLQTKPSTPYYVLFKMMKKHEFYFIIRVWKEWLLFTRRRKFWQNFVLKYANFEDDYELKQKVLYNFIFKLNYYNNRQDKFFMNMTPYSFIGMLQTTKKIKKMMNDENKDEIEWKFITERNKQNKQETLNCNLLVRSFILSICAKSQTGVSISKMIEKRAQERKEKRRRRREEEEEEEANEENKKKFSFQELKDILVTNRKIVRKKLMNQINHEKGILNATNSHFSAIEFHKAEEKFSLVEDISILQTMNPKGTPFQIETMKLSKEIIDSIEEMIKENRKPLTILPIYRLKMIQKISRFKRSFRMPRNMLTSQISLNNEVANSISNSSANLGTIEEEQIPATKQASNLKNFLIITYKQPVIEERPFPIESPKLREIRQLKESIEKSNVSVLNSKITKVSKENVVKSFGVLSFREKVKNMTLDEMLNGIRRFFLNMVDIRIDISNPIIYDKEDEKSLNIIPVENRHQIRRRINAFIAELTGFDVSNTVPLYVKAEKFVYDCISTIFTVFNEMMKHKETAKLCDSFPFPDFALLDSQPFLSVRSTIMSSIFEKFPKLAKEAMLNLDTNKKLEKMSPIKIGSHDLMLLSDANISVLLLPHILKPELIKNFLHSKQLEKALKMKKENPNMASTASFG